MKKTRLLSKLLTLSSIGIASTTGLIAVSCKSDNEIDKLFFTVKKGDIECTFCDKGAAIYSMKYKDQFVTYHPKDKETFLRDDLYHGKGLGRVAGRIKDGIINVDGDIHKVEVNETSGKKNNTLHGGNNGFSSKTFAHTIENDTAKDTTTVTFKYTSPDGEAGFPGKVEATFAYTFYADNKVDIEITGKVSDKPTLLNMTNHPYFRLGNTGDILNHELTIHNGTKLATFDLDAGDQIVTGTDAADNVAAETTAEGVKITPFDFTKGKKIGQDIVYAKKYDQVSGGYDHIWYNGKDEQAGDPQVKMVTLQNKATNIKLEVESDANAVIIYANCYPHTEVEMCSGGNDALYSGLTVEPIKFCTKDNFNTELLVKAGKTFTRNITYTFSDI